MIYFLFQNKCLDQDARNIEKKKKNELNIEAQFKANCEAKLHI